MEVVMVDTRRRKVHHDLTRRSPKLTDQQYQVWHMREVLDMPWRAIEAQLGMAHGNGLSQYKRAVKKILAGCDV